jgi:hypothetical protein
MFLEGLLGVTILTIGYNIFRTHKIQQKLKMIAARNASLTDAMLLPSGTNYDASAYESHIWQTISDEVIYSSMFTIDCVRARTDKCKTCGLIHRYITNGFKLATDKSLIDLEGYYLNGLKCSDVGCHEVDFIEID